MSACDCCEDNSDGCPHGSWISLYRWEGGFTVPNNLRHLLIDEQSVWERLGLDKYSNSNWQFRVVIWGTGSIPDLTELCLQQNRRVVKEWLTPLTDRPESEFYKLEVIHDRWFDSPLSSPVSVLTGGDFTLTLKTGLVSETTPQIPHNATASQVQTALRALPNAARAGTINVTGTTLLSSHLTIALVAPLDFVSISVADADQNLIGTPPNIITHVITEGSATANEEQYLISQWPADGGTFTLSVTAAGTTQTTASIPHNCSSTQLRDALLALINLDTPPTLVASDSVIGGFGSNAVHSLSIADLAVVTGGAFTLTLTINGSTQTTGTITVASGTAGVEAALSALPNALATDEFSVTAHPSGFPISIKYEGTLANTNIPTIGVTSALIGGDVFVSVAPITFEGNTIGLKAYLTFVGALSLTDVGLTSSTSLLISKPRLLVTNLNPNDVFDFRAEYEPLQVGTIWNGHIRTAYGNAEARSVKLLQKEYTENPGITGPGSVVIQEQPCGYGVVLATPCSNSPITQVGVPKLGDSPTVAITTQNSVGELVTESYLPFEFEMQIRCLSCHYSSEYNLWGMNEQSITQNRQIHDVNETGLYEPISPMSCGGTTLSDCRKWGDRPNNEGYLSRRKFGPDGFDGHLINNVFYADGALKARKPVCDPDVVLLGGGYYLERYFSRSQAHYTCSKELGVRIACAPKPKHEFCYEVPTSDINRLKEVYGTKFSYWGGWIHPDSRTNTKIRCTFEAYDLTNIKVLFLGGFPIGACPQTSGFAGTVAEQPSFCSGGWLHSEAEPADNFFQGGWRGSLNKEFETNTLEPLKRWLDLPGKVLVLDGGAFPVKFLQALGLTTTAETSMTYNPLAGDPTLTLPSGTLNGSYFTTPVWGAELPDWFDENFLFTQFQPLSVEPVSHPFTIQVSKGVDSNGDAILVLDPTTRATFQNSNIAGQPMSTGGATKGLINLSQKWVWGRDIGIKPAGGLREYTTNVLRLTPGTNAQVIGRVQGKIAAAPWVIGNSFVTIDVDYPAVVVEPWKASFRLRFTHLGVTDETVDLSPTATAIDIELALEALSNIGPGITVMGGPLGGSIDIYFDNSALQGTDVELLEVIGSGPKIELVREGAAGVDEIQRISGVGHSRVVISYATELVEPDLWGVNWNQISAEDAGGGNGPFASFEDDNEVKIIFQDVAGNCYAVPQEDYCKNGYNFGLGLSYLAAKQFLLNLLERRDEY